MVPRLKRRADFVRLNRSGGRAVTKGLVLQAAAFSDAGNLEAGAAKANMRVGFTATRKLGKAVIRNRVKRRLRAVADELLPVLAKPGHDFVLIGRHDTATRDMAKLRSDLKQALGRLDLLRPDGAAPPPVGQIPSGNPLKAG